MNKMESLSSEGVAAVEDLSNHLSESAPDNGTINVTGTADQYYPLMYFVDKDHVGEPTTCGGTTSHAPLVGSRDMCAHMCNQDIHECVGFIFFPKSEHLSNGVGLCSLMASFKTA